MNRARTLTGHDAPRVIDGGHAADRGKQCVEQVRVADGDEEAELRYAMRVGVRRGGKDVSTRVSHGDRNVLEQAHAVRRLDHDLDLELRGAGGIPLDVDHALRVSHEALHVGTIRTVDGHAAAARDEAHDLVACDGAAAVREVDEEVRVTLGNDAAARAFATVARLAAARGARLLVAGHRHVRLEELLASGKLDCVMGSFSMTGRENEYRWAGPYLASRQVVAVDPESDIYTLADLEGKVVAVQSTTKPESILLNHTNENVPQIKELYSFSDRSYLNPALVEGLVDAIAAHESSLLTYEKDYGVTYRILSEPLLEVGLGTAFDINDTRGIDVKLTHAYQEMLADGTMERLVSKYFDDPSPFLNVEGLS